MNWVYKLVVSEKSSRRIGLHLQHSVWATTDSPCAAANQAPSVKPFALELQWQKIIFVAMEPMTKSVLEFLAGKFFSTLLLDNRQKVVKNVVKFFQLHTHIKVCFDKLNLPIIWRFCGS